MLNNNLLDYVSGAGCLQLRHKQCVRDAKFETKQREEKSVNGERFQIHSFKSFN